VQPNEVASVRDLVDRQRSLQLRHTSEPNRLGHPEAIQRKIVRLDYRDPFLRLRGRRIDILLFNARDFTFDQRNEGALLDHLGSPKFALAKKDSRLARQRPRRRELG
jgi:hypothetical protein